MAALIWFKQDLRLFDNQAVSHAWQNHKQVYAIVLETEKTWQEHHWAPIKRDLYERRINCLGAELAKLGVELTLLSVDEYSNSAGAICKFAQENKVTHCYFNREMPADERKRERAVISWLEQHDIQVQVFDDVIAVAPERIKTGQGSYYKKFTPYYRNWLSALQELRLEPDSELTPKGNEISFNSIKVLGEKKTSKNWPVKTEAVLAMLDEFIDERISHYHEGRDTPSERGTSGISPLIEIGALGVKTILRRLQQLSPQFPSGLEKGAETWLSELAWRDFYQHLMWHVPRLSRGKAFIEETDNFAWENDTKAFKAWCAGQTGFPIVDAGMRQLNETGWMHNRLRMIVASFLVKDLLVDWRWGEQYFMENLIDGSFPANNGGWQWSASTGTDAVPYFRVFNPYRQSERFDPQGTFIRKWVKELADVPTKHIHEPYAFLKKAGREKDYQAPIVEHSRQRELFLTKFKQVKHD